MLIATLVNLQGKRSVVDVPTHASRMPPYLLLREGRAFIIDYSDWEPAPEGSPCTATFKELEAHRTLDISHLKLHAPKPQDVLQPAEEEEAA